MNMGKFKISVKLSNLEVSIEGDRESAPVMSQQIGRQLSGLLQPSILIDAPEQPTHPEIIAEFQSDSPRRVTRRKRAVVGKGTARSAEAESEEYNWKHDPAKWGTPLQGWTTAVKSVWLLRVVKEECGVEELTASGIANTYNRQFRQSGEIRAHNVSRDLGKLKAAGREAQVAENTEKTPSTWYLTQSGMAATDAIIASKS
jgi:hypothetical protein